MNRRFNMKRYILLIIFLATVQSFNNSMEDAYDGDIYKPDTEEIGGYFEGDMILSDDQYDYVNGFSNRNGIKNVYFRWENNIIPYDIDNSSNFEQEHLLQIHRAFKIFHQVSCLKFRKRIITDGDYLFITDNATRHGCYSSVGRRGGKQNLNLAKETPGQGCFRIGTILHELLHTLGFYHQQSTPNRDEHIEIVWDKIEPNAHANFKKYRHDDVTNFGQIYDYDSVLHYASHAFSVGGRETILTKKANVNIGQRKGLSSYDIEKLNLMYDCYGEPINNTISVKID